MSARLFGALKKIAVGQRDARASRDPMGIVFSLFLLLFQDLCFGDWSSEPSDSFLVAIMNDLPALA